MDNLDYERALKSKQAAEFFEEIRRKCNGYELYTEERYTERKVLHRIFQACKNRDSVTSLSDLGKGRRVLPEAVAGALYLLLQEDHVNPLVILRSWTELESFTLLCKKLDIHVEALAYQYVDYSIQEGILPDNDFIIVLGSEHWSGVESMLKYTKKLVLCQTYNYNMRTRKYRFQNQHLTRNPKK